jgi:hypothetical protein
MMYNIKCDEMLKFCLLPCTISSYAITGQVHQSHSSLLRAPFLTSVLAQTEDSPPQHIKQDFIPATTKQLALTRYLVHCIV